MVSSSREPFEPDLRDSFGSAQAVRGSAAEVAMSRERRDILHAIATDQPLAEVFGRLCRLTEARVSAGCFAVMLGRTDGASLRTIAAPSLPIEFCAAFDALLSKPRAANVVRALLNAEAVELMNLGSDPRWRVARPLTEKYGLRARTTLPLYARDGRVLGAYVLFWRADAAPIAQPLELVRSVGHLASIAIERAAGLRELQRSEQRFRLLFANHPDAVFQFNAQGVFVDVNDSALALVGYPREQVLGLEWREMLAPDLHASVQSHFEKTLAGEMQRYEVRVLHCDGHVLFLDVINQPVYEDDRSVGVFGIARDITERKRNEQRLQLLQRAVEVSGNGICIADARRPDMPLTYVNPAFERITGYSAAEVLERNCRFLQAPNASERALEIMRHALATGDEAQVVLRNLRRDGSEFWNELHLSPITDESGQITHWLGVQNDVSARKRHEDDLRHHASHDALTGLPNRTLLEDRIAQSCQFAARHNHQLAMLFIDLDGFKAINDSYGHHCGDLVLRAAASRVLACVSRGDTVARLGGDEFVVVLADINGAEAAVATTEAILARLAEPYGGCHGSPHFNLHLTASAGLALWDGRDIPPMQLVQQADLAMFKAKQAGRNTWAWYSGALDEHLSERLQLRHELQAAMGSSQFHLVYQPQVSADGKSVVALETLVRWEHPTLGTVAPADFIPLAEQTGQIVTLGAWILQTACQQAAEWARAGHEWPISVNVSALQFMRPGFVHSVKQILAGTDLPASRLELEITESVVLQDGQQTLRVMQELRALGVRTALDDFGQGYSSLAYVKQLPLDKLKIDRSFVRDVLVDPRDAAITQTVIALGHWLNLQVVAEGVETQAQFQFLRDRGCDVFQGYLFAHPQPAHLLPAAVDNIGLHKR